MRFGPQLLAKISSVHDGTNKAKDAQSKATDNEDKVERQAEEDNEGEEGESQGQGEEGKGQRGKAETASALAAQASVKMDKDGNPMVVLDTVMCHDLKNKDKYDKRKANVERLNVRAAVVTIL